MPRRFDVAVVGSLHLDIMVQAPRLPGRDETLMGFGFPKEEREALVAGEPDKFQLPGQADMRYQWVVARMDALDIDEMTELVTDAWRMCVPKSVAARHDCQAG